MALHVATLVSVLFVYRARIARLARGLFTRGEGSSWPFLLRLALASVPAAVVGIAFQDWFEARFDDSLFAGTMILVTGSFVWSSRWAREGMRSAVDVLPVVVAAAVSVLAGTVVPFLAVLAALVFIPFFRRSGLTSAFEYLGDRFGLTARLYGMASFVFLQLIRIAQVLFLESDEVCGTSYADRKGKYQKQTAITLPKL